ncbi:hypothetical protein HQ535_16805 [bacterium]|nr:hypothetical protein [bacterium]
MSRLGALLIALVLVTAACGDDDSAETTTAPTTTAASTTAPATTAPATTTTTATATEGGTTAAPATTTVAESHAGLVIRQIGFDTDFQSGWVLIHNTGTAPVSLAGYFLCQRPSYFGLPDVEIAPDGILWVAPIDAGDLVDTSPSIGAGGQIGAINSSSGEMGLYSASDFGSSDAIVSYVEWGNTGHGRSSVAVGAGIWGEGEFVPVPAGDAAGAIIWLQDTEPGAGSWEEVGAP